MAIKSMQVSKKFPGLWLTPNPFDAPEGALLECDNCQIDRPNLIEKVRGVNRYGDALSNSASAMGEFDETVVLLDGTTLKYDASGTWTAMTGTFSPPDNEHRLRMAESLFSLYFTTSTGPYRLDQLGNTPKPAGMPQGLDIQASFTGTGLGWMGVVQVAYKVVWLRVDDNGQEIPGAASFREVVTNSKTDVSWTFSGGTVTVAHTGHGYTSGDTVQITESSDALVESPTSTITVTGPDSYTYTIAGSPAASGTAKAHRVEDVAITTTIPDGVEAGDFLEVYRTETSADDTSDPGARLLKVDRLEVTSGDITAGTITFTDDYAEAFLGDDLVSNSNAEGVTQTNDRPPFARDVAFYKGHMFYANTRQPHFLELQLLDTGAVAAGSDTITIGSDTYTFASAEDIGAQEFQLFTSPTDFPTLAESVEATAKSLVRVINRNASNSTYYAYYTSGPLEPPGKILIRRRDFTDTSIAVTANDSDTGGSFSPVLPTSGTTVSTKADLGPNRLYRSKFEQPDSVPLSNYDPIGSAREEILRIVPSRDSLFIFTSRRILRLSGDDEKSFTIRTLEHSIHLIANESPALLNDAIYCWTSQGVASVDENGVKIIGFFGTEKEVNKIRSFPNFASLAWGLGIEQDRKYILWTQGVSGDPTVTVGWQYSYTTNTWTRRLKAVVAGVVLKETDELFLAHAVDSVVLKERRQFGTSNADYVDEDIPCTITAVGTTTDSDGNTVSQLIITFTYTTEPIATDWLVAQNQDAGRIEAITDNGGNSWTITLDTLGTYTTGAATASIPIVSRIRWAPLTLGNPAAQKQYTYCQVSLEADTWREIELGFVNDVINTETFLNPIIVALSGGWGSMRWSSDPWGSGGPIKSTPIRVPVPRRYQRCRGLMPIFRHSKARASFEIVTQATVPRIISDRTQK